MKRSSSQKWYGGVGQLSEAFFSHPFSLTHAFTLGRELRRRFDARHCAVTIDSYLSVGIVEIRPLELIS